MPERKPRIAIVSSFIDKHHGTEHCVMAWLLGLLDECDVHVYSQRIEDIDLSRIRWHKLSHIRGPHLLNYLWWFAANQIKRAWHRLSGKYRYDLIYSPGINCFDADLVSVHILFAELLRAHKSNARFRDSAVRLWPALIHRSFYYRLIAILERYIYRKSNIRLIPITERTATEVKIRFQSANVLSPIYFGLDFEAFNPQRRLRLREQTRREFGLEQQQFALLLIGNDWRNKGLRVILEAMSYLQDPSLRLLAVGSDSPAPYLDLIRERSLSDSVRFLDPRKDVEVFYSAADAYIGPSQEDALPFPPAEAMACGLPVVISSACGLFEIIENGGTGFVLHDPSDSFTLAGIIRQLRDDAALRQRVGEAAASMIQRFTWERNAQHFREALFDTLAWKRAGKSRIQPGDSAYESPVLRS